MRATIRLRLALIQTAIFAVVAAALVLGVYALTASSLSASSTEPRSRAERLLGLPAGTLLDRSTRGDFTLPSSPLPRRPTLPQIAADVQAQTRAQLLDRVLRFSVILVGIATFVTFVAGWLMARRSLRPIRRITSRARMISENDLRQPIAMEGPRDELHELADTFDEMLGRLDRAFAAQRLFAANASHELRTPLTLIRTRLDVTLAKPNATREDLEAMAKVIREAIERSARLIEGLLMLARANGPVAPETVALDGLVRDTLDDLREQADRRALSIVARIDPCAVVGDPLLLKHVVRNVLENAIIHNVEGGHIEVRAWRDTRARVLVSNGGSMIVPTAVDDLFLPLHRGGADRVQDGSSGFGLGLAIVKAVTEAHHGSVVATALADGGLAVEIALPPAGSTNDVTESTELQVSLPG